MKINQSNQPDEILVSMSEFWAACRRSKKKIAIFALVGMFLGTALMLISPVRYSVIGTFKESYGSTKTVESKLESLVGLKEDNGNTTGVMLSRAILEPVVRNLNLQASLTDLSQMGITNNALENLKVFFAYFKYTFRVRPIGGIISGKIIVPDETIIADQNLGIQCTEVDYPKDYFTALRVVFVDEDRYELYGSGQNPLGTFRLNEKVNFDNIHFKLNRASSVALSSKTYLLHLVPLPDAANSLINDIGIKKEKECKNILKISYAHSNRHLAAAIVNEIMFSYKAYLKNEHKRIVRDQLDYLELRQNQTLTDLEHIMAVHAQYLKEHLGHGGFIELSKEIDFCAQSQSRYNSRLMDINLEIKALENKKYGEYYNLIQKHEVAGQIFKELTDLKQRRDILALALKESSREEPEQQKAALMKQLDRLKKIDADLKDIDALLGAVQQRELVFSELLDNESLSPLVNAWLLKLKTSASELNQNFTLIQEKSKLDELAQHREWFVEYLKNLKQQNLTQAKMIREHIVRQEGDAVGFQGIDLETATNLYLEYHTKQEELAAHVKQLEFLLTQMQNPNFELSSLASILNDHVSTNIISEVSDLLKKSKDERNRSSKDQERFKEFFNLSRSFLTTHLSQNRELTLLRENLIKDKIYDLQKVTMDLIHQKISILDEHMDDYVLMRCNSLKNERALIKQELQNLNKSISHLPEKWFAEECIELRTEMSLNMVQELGSLVEAKNIAHDMEQIECMPLDLAVAPSLPLSPRILFFAFFGAFGGALLCIAWVCYSTALKGVKASPESLELRGQHVSGTLSSKFAMQSAKNLSTIRKLIAFLEGALIDDKSSLSHEGARRVMLLNDTGWDYSDMLCRFLSKKGGKVLKIDCNFEKKNSTPGKLKSNFLLFLEGKEQLPVIESSGEYDQIHSEGHSDYGIELLGSKRFSDYLESISQKYDWIVLVTAYAAANIENGSILMQSDYIAATILDNYINEINPFLDTVNRFNKPTTFLFHC